MKIYATLFALIITATINAQNPGTKTIFTENFGFLDTNESISANSSIYSHTGTGDFIHKIVNTQGALNSKCFGQLDSSGASSASLDIQLYGGNTYEYKAFVKTIQSRVFVTLRINVGGLDVAISDCTSVNGVWEELTCTYTPSQDEIATLMFVKTAGYRANIDKINVICTSCSDKNLVFDFNDSKEGWINGGGCNLFIGNDGFIMKATGPVVAVARSGTNDSTANLDLSTSYYNTARITFKTPYPSHQAGNGKLFFHSLAGGNAPFATFNFPRDPSNTSTYQTVEIDLSSTPTAGTYSGDIARLGFRAPWGINQNGRTGDTCYWQKLELFNNNILADFSASDSIFCLGDSVSFTDLSTGGPNSFLWDFGDGTTDTSINPTHIYNSPGTYDVSLIVSGNTVIDTITKSSFVTINTIPIVSGGINQAVCFGDSVTLIGSSTTNTNITYTWDSSVTDGTAFTPTTTTTYTVTGTDANNCTATDQVDITVNNLPTVSAGADQAVCQGSSVILNASGATNYSWDNGVLNGVDFIPTLTAIYTVIGTGNNGCTAIDSLDITVNALPTVVAGPGQTVCEGSSVVLNASGATNFSWDNSVANGITFIPNSTTTYTVTGTDVNGCVNTSTVDITVNPKHYIISIVGLCVGDSSFAGGAYQKVNGVYYDSLSNSAGCDSIIETELTIDTLIIVNLPLNICSGDSLLINGNYELVSDTFYNNTVSSGGCDSLTITSLTVNNPSTGTDNQTACDSFTWIDGNSYTSSNNTASFTIQNSSGCDSMVTLNLVINNSNTGVDIQTSCDSFTWINGNSYTSSNNTATFTLQNSAGCDSLVTLDLVINNSYSSTLPITACNSFDWEGITYDSSGTYTNVYQNVDGCDSSITLDLTINNGSTSTVLISACNSFEWDGTTYDSTGFYTNNYTDVNGCDSTVSLDLIIFNLSVTIDTLGGDLVASGGSNYIWNTSATDSTITPDTNGLYVVVSTDANGCADTATFNVTYIASTGILDNSISTISIYPNPVNDILNILSSDNIKSLEVKDLLGRIVNSNTDINSKSILLNTSNFSNNVYLLSLIINNKLVIKKIIISH
ncbi:PKD domain-containing protein [Flavobacteriales bacterium]|nr:PKD domain-containing protein [Flavobacteriales bacterium]